MICKEIDLYKYFNIERNGVSGGILHTYVRMSSCELKKKIRPAMIVIPGGGYEFLSDREGEPVALAYLNKGYSSFVLKYSINTSYPTPLLEACMAVAYVRENAAMYSVDKEHIAAIGFSAGGHLCGMLATLYTAEEIIQTLGKHANMSRPNAVVLSYPVITMQNGLTHEGTRRVISANGKLPYNKFSIEKCVNKNSVPAFIWHTMEDTCVPVENSMLLAAAYKDADVPFSLHVFEKGWHGLSLINEETCDVNNADLFLFHVGKWLELSLDWLQSRGFGIMLENGCVD